MVFSKLRPDRAEDQGIVSTIDKDVSNKWKWVWLKEETKTKVTLDNNKEREVNLVVGDSICKINIPGSAYCNWFKCEATFLFNIFKNGNKFML